jgi:peptidyl-prolyl cis-trans isomerase B (cyclophilin B)
VPDVANPTKASSGSQFYIVTGKKYTLEELDQDAENIRNAKKSQLLRECIMMPKYQSVLAEIQKRQQAQDGAWMNSFFEKSDTLIVKEKPDYKPFAFTPEQKTLYTTVGGTPFLDGDYTVFGKVIKGIEVADKITAVAKDQVNRPNEDIRMVVTSNKCHASKSKRNTVTCFRRLKSNNENTGYGFEWFVGAEAGYAFTAEGECSAYCNSPKCFCSANQKRRVSPA